MAIQVNLDIPSEIQAGIDSGDLVRIGGVVRDRISGSIVKYLSEVPGSASLQGTTGRAAASLMGPRGIAVAVLSVAAVGAVGATLLVAAQKRKRASNPELPECVENYQASLRAYLEAARNGTLDAAAVSQLISDLAAVKEHSGNGGITIDFSTEQPAALVNLVVAYTGELANRTAFTHSSSLTKLALHPSPA